MPDPAPAAEPADADEIGYGAALSELESILSEIEDDAVDVDVLATRVRRAAELLRICRDRIASARVEVTQIVADLEQGAGTVDLTTTADLDDLPSLMPDVAAPFPTSPLMVAERVATLDRTRVVWGKRVR